METEKNTLFIAYIEKTMSDSERRAFVERLEKDTALHDEFSAFSNIYKVLENRFSTKRADVLQSIQQADTNFKLSQDSTISKGKVILFKPWHYAVAATVILVVGLFLFNDFGKPTYSEFATQDAISLTMRGNSNATAKEAETAFNNGDYKEALTHFNNLLQNAPDTVQFQLYKAQALIEQDKFEQAEKILKHISEGNSVYVSKSRWWMALSKLKQKKYIEVEQILNSIDADSEEYSKAQELLKEL